MVNTELSKIIRHQRRSLGLSVSDTAARAGISISHLTRIEHGQRFPSARTIAKLAGPLRINISDLMVLAGFLSSEKNEQAPNRGKLFGKLDPLVAEFLAQQPIEIQRMVIPILKLLRTAKSSWTD